LRDLRRSALFFVVIASALTAGAAVAVAAAPGGLSNRTVSVGSTYTITGQTGTLRAALPPATGPVTLTGRWDAGSRQVLAKTATTADGRYRLTISLRRRGSLDLRLATPDHQVAHVVLTVV
jgi:hypothetical protein